MTTPSKCPRCGATLPPDTPPESCPKCLIQLGLDRTEPGADTTMVMGFLVWKAYWRSSFTSSIMEMKAGSRWPMVDRDMASSTRGCTSEGPGPIRVRTGG